MDWSSGPRRSEIIQDRLSTRQRCSKASGTSSGAAVTMMRDPFALDSIGFQA